MAAEKFVLKGEFIKLDSLLKALGLAVTGGAAKELVASGAVSVNGQKETRRGAKLRGGEIVACNGRTVEIVTSGS